MVEAKCLRKRDYLMLSSEFISYLERHRIFELFQELAMMLLIKKPEDHVLFLKQSIDHAVRRLDIPRLIILAPPECDKLQLAEELRAELNVPLITYNDILEESNDVPCNRSSSMLEKLRLILVNYMNLDCDGWILLDFPSTEKEARSLQRAGIIATHVIEITSADIITDSSASFKSFLKSDYYKEIRGLRHVYSKSLKTVDVKNKKMKEVFEECLSIVRCRNHSGSPTIFRILLIDYAGTERSRCLAQHLVKEYSIIHIKFNEAVEQISMQETELGEKVYKAKQRNSVPSELKIKVLEEFLQQNRASRRGWVLTGFVTTVEDLECLDATDAQPNRLIVIVAKNNALASISESSESSSLNCGCGEDGSCATTENTYNSETEHSEAFISDDVMKCILEYAGETAFVVEEHSQLRVMKTRVDSYLMQPPPSVPPRVPPLPSKDEKCEMLEFDPDDEPCTEIFDEIRQPEPVLPLL